MKFKPQPWQLIVVIAVLCCAAVGTMVWYHSGTLTQAALLKRLPTNDALVLWIDFAELRKAGFLQLLSGAKASEDPEYQSFVHATRFDYMNDLDSALAAFPRSGSSYFLAQGRFDWKSLRAYVAREKGQCVNSLCRLVGSTPDRHISFLPLRQDLMAMAVSQEAYAVDELGKTPPTPYPAVPEGMVWLRFPGSLPKSVESMPAGMSAFARIVQDAPMVTISFVPEQNHLAARLDVQCRTGQEAEDMASALNQVTSLARTMFEREHQIPNPADFSGIVTSGEFRREGTRVLGHWPIERAFVQNLLGTQ